MLSEVKTRFKLDLKYRYVHVIVFIRISMQGNFFYCYARIANF